MDDKFYNNLVTLLNLFKNRPYHLAKYLADNSALNSDFIEKIKRSDKLNDISKNKDDMFKNFKDIDDLENFYDSLLNESSNYKNKEKDLNEKLNELIKLEKYEDAARLRDYMKNNNINRK